MDPCGTPDFTKYDDESFPEICAKNSLLVKQLWKQLM
jgi:hypothetical protein